MILEVFAVSARFSLSRKLRRLHQDLVMTGALTEAEFWSARKVRKVHGRCIICKKDEQGARKFRRLRGRWGRTDTIRIEDGE